MSLVWYGDDVVARTERAIREGIDEVTSACVRSAIPLAPIKTGALRGSIRMIPAREVRTGVIAGLWGSFNINYAIFQELGTIYMSGKRFLRRAANRHYGQLRAAIGRRLAKIGVKT